MPTVLEQAVEELKAMPPDAQDAIARDLLDTLRSETKWDQLFADRRSDALFDHMTQKVRSDSAAGKVSAGDPQIFSIPLQLSARHGIKSLFAEHPDGQAVGAEQRQEGVVHDVETTGEGTKRGQDQAPSIADEAGAADRVAIDR